MESAATERAKLKAIGDARSYLGKLVLEWAKASPEDSRIPEALYIAFNANGGYKYGCSGWEHDDDVLRETSSPDLKANLNPGSAGALARIEREARTLSEEEMPVSMQTVFRGG